MKKRNKALLVGLGASLVALAGLAASMQRKISKFKKAYPDAKTFTGEEYKFDDQVFLEESFAAMFSGLEIDLSKAIPAAQEMTLHLKAEFSGIEVVVPASWNVIVTGELKQSGLSCDFDEEDFIEGAPSLRIEYNLSKSGLNVKKADEVIEEEQEDEGVSDSAKNDTPLES